MNKGLYYLLNVDNRNSGGKVPTSKMVLSINRTNKYLYRVNGFIMDGETIRDLFVDCLLTYLHSK